MSELHSTYTWNSNCKPEERYFMIGNGFDIACGLPTRYGDFLEVIHNVENTLIYFQNNTNFKKQWIEQGAQNIGEYVALVDNFWYKYFSKIYFDKNRIIGINWIDFEKEIQSLVSAIEREILNHNLSMSIDPVNYVLDPESNLNEHLSIALENLKAQYLAKHSGAECCAYNPSYKDLAVFLESELVDFIRAFILYLKYITSYKTISSDSVIEGLLNKIGEGPKSYIITFNYTNTLEQLLSANYNMDCTKICHIHGKICLEQETRDSVVLGMGSIYKDDERQWDHESPFSWFRKTAQRDRCNTDRDFYKLKEVLERDQQKPRELIVFGHSLSAIDSDIISELLTTTNMRTVIYYYSDDSCNKKAELINELSSYLGRDFVKGQESSGTFRFDPTTRLKHI